MSRQKSAPPERPRRRVRRFLRWTLTLLLFAAALLYAAGLPASWANALLVRYLPAGLHAECGGILHRPGKGFVIRDLRVWSEKDRVTPLLTASELRLDPSLSHRLRQGEWIGSLVLSDAKFISDLGLWADDLKTSQPIRLETLNLRLALGDGMLRVEQASARFAGFRLNIEGGIPLAILRETLSRRRSDPSRESPFPRICALLAPHIALVQSFVFAQDPELWLRITETDSGEIPIRLDLTLTHRGASNLRGAEFRRIDLKAYATPDEARLETLEFEDRQGRVLSVDGEVDFRSRIASVRIQNTLPRFAVESVSPVSITQLFQRLAIRVEGDAEFDLRFGPSPFATFGQQIQGHVLATDAFYRDAGFPKVEIQIDYRNRVLRLDSFRGEVGLGTSRGPVEGHLLYDLNTGELRLAVQGAFKPEAVVSLVGPTAEKFIREWEFQGKPPQLDVTLDRATRSADPLLDLKLKATDILSRGALFDFADVHLILTEDQIRIADMVIGRGTELLEGNLVADSGFDQLDVDFQSSLRLPDIAPILGATVVNALRPYRLRGSNWMKIKGRLDLGPRREHDLTGQINFNDLIWDWVKFDNLSAHFALKKQALNLTDIQGTLSGGTLKGEVSTQDMFDGPGSFDIKLDLQKTDLFQVITAATDTTDTPYTGQMTFSLKLAGAIRGSAESPATQTYRGEGSIQIKDGTLFRIPLLLGLSRILSHVVRGFGYASQTDFRADFKVADGRISSDNLFLEGRILSVAGEGHYGFDRSIKANLRVQLFSQGILSDALRIVLWPIRKLIEIQLSGSLDEPEWQPRNLPKELFGK